jgi:hypothetical protein
LGSARVVIAQITSFMSGHFPSRPYSIEL